LLSSGGILGSISGVSLFQKLLSIGQLDLIISLLFLIFLAGIGALMLLESVAVMRGKTQSARTPLNRPVKALAHRLPFRLKFPRSGLHIGVVPPWALGFGIGVLAEIMGVGGGFILIPAMIYLLRMPTNVVIGTSLFQVLVVTCITIILQATATQ